MHSTIFTIGVVIISFIFFTMDADSQRLVNVRPNINNPLNEVIAGDTTSTGDRVDENTVYVLERGGHYLLSGSVENRNWPLRIVAEEGEGRRPFIQPMVGDGGATSRPFRIRGDLEMRGLHISSMDNAGGIEKNMIRISADSVRIVVDDCVLDYESQSIFRFDNPSVRFFLTNSVVSNIGDTRDPDNGRGIDFRGNFVDTLFVENNVFYNITSRVTRDGGAVTKYFHFNHNTIVNIGQHITTVGRAIELNFTNNMVVNGVFLGFHPDILGDDWGAIRVSTFSTFEEEPIEQMITIRNNNFYLDERVSEAYPDGVLDAPPFNVSTYELIDSLGLSDYIFDEAIAFMNSPEAPVEVVETWYTNPLTTAQMPDEGGPFNFAYDIHTSSYTASTAGQPLGSLVWFDMAVSVDRKNYFSAEEYSLYQNYPNPFNPATNIRFTIPVPHQVSLTVFNVVGQRVAALTNEYLEAGTHTIPWNGIADNGMVVPSGIYIFRIQAGDFQESKRMLMVK